MSGARRMGGVLDGAGAFGLEKTEFWLLEYWARVGTSAVLDKRVLPPAGRAPSARGAYDESGVAGLAPLGKSAPVAGSAPLGMLLLAEG